MPRLKLTERSIARLEAPAADGRQQLHWDLDLKGFGVLCSGTTRAKTFVVQRAIGGRTRRVTVGPCNVLTLVDARRRAQAVLSEFYSGRDPKQARHTAATLRATLADYLRARKDLRPNSVTLYRNSIERHLSRWLDRPLRDIAPEMVEQRHREIAEEVAGRGRYSGAATANAAMVALRTLWSFASERDPAMPPSPVKRLRRQWFAVPRRERHVSADQLPAFYRAVIALDNPVARDLIVLLLFTGMRRGEATSLRWTDVDLAAGIVRVPAASTKSGRKLDLPMSDVVLELLTARRALGDTDFVFPANSKSGHVEETGYLFRATGFRISAHDLRRGYVTVAESCDISPIALKALINHSLGRDVTSGYILMSTERLRAAAQIVADRLSALCGLPCPSRP